MAKVPAKRTIHKRPRPGVYHDVPMDEYKAWPWINNSSMGSALRSIAHYVTDSTRERPPPTASMALGSLVHCIVLENNHVDERYAVEPDFTDACLFPYRRPELTTDYKSAKARWRKEHRGKVFVDQATWDKALACATAIRDHLGDTHLDGYREVSVVAKCPETGQRIKARLDLVWPTQAIVDIKTTLSADDFERAIETYDYGRQGAVYQDAWELATGEKIPVILVAAETEPPYGVRSGPIAEDLLGDGRERYMLALRRIARYHATGTIEGYKDPFEWRRVSDGTVGDVTIKGENFRIR